MSEPLCTADFVTEEMIREQARHALSNKVQAEEYRAKSDPKYQKRYSEDLFETPPYRTWISQRVADARRDGRLVTSQQLTDAARGRVLQEGDHVRYVGPTRIEHTQSGKNYVRETGEIGRITQVLAGPDDKLQFHFLPDVPAHAHDPHGPEVFVSTLHFAQGTSGYFLIERIVGGDDG